MTAPIATVPTACFRLVGLDADAFEALFALPSAELEARGMRRVVADADHGFPCRVSLEDARVGDELLLLPFDHLDEPASPYRAGGPIFVRRGVARAVLEPGVLPPYITRRMMSVRAYDARHMMLAGEVWGGEAVRVPIERLLADEAVSYIHLHNAGRGCFACRVERA